MSRVKYKNPYTLQPYETVKDAEGSVTTTYNEDAAYTIKASIQPKTRNLVVSPMGERIGATLIGFTELSTVIKEKDGVCYESTSTPDYYVSAVDVYRTHKTFELTRIGV